MTQPNVLSGFILIKTATSEKCPWVLHSIHETWQEYMSPYKELKLLDSGMLGFISFKLFYKMFD